MKCDEDALDESIGLLFSVLVDGGCSRTLRGKIREFLEREMVTAEDQSLEIK